MRYLKNLFTRFQNYLNKRADLKALDTLRAVLEEDGEEPDVLAVMKSRRGYPCMLMGDSGDVCVDVYMTSKGVLVDGLDFRTGKPVYLRDVQRLELVYAKYHITIYETETSVVFVRNDQF